MRPGFSRHFFVVTVIAVILPIIALFESDTVEFETRVEVFIDPPAFASNNRALQEYFSHRFVDLLADERFVHETVTTIDGRSASCRHPRVRGRPKAGSATGFEVAVVCASAGMGDGLVVALLDRAEKVLDDVARSIVLGVIEEKEEVLNVITRRRLFQESVRLEAASRMREDELSMELEKLRHRLTRRHRFLRIARTTHHIVARREGYLRRLVGPLFGLILVLGIVEALLGRARRSRCLAYLQTHVEVPFLAFLPHVADEVPVRRATLGVAAEAFRALRTELMARACRHFVVVSWGQGEGSTFVCTNIALACAEGGMRVLLVDGNLRRPGLHEQFGVSNDVGLSDALIDTSINELLWDAPDESIRFLAAGPRPPDPSSLFSGERWERLVQELSSNDSDIIIIDAPAMAASSDVLHLAAVVEGVIIVTRPGFEPPEQVAAAVRRLSNSGVPVVGMVCNDVDVNTASRRAYGHRTV